MNPETNAEINLNYQCPHCGATMDVEPELVGEEINCVRCHKPIHVDAVSTYPLQETPAPAAEPIPHVDRPADDERELNVMHPAMFRNHPFAFTGVLVVLALGIAGLLLYLAHLADINIAANELERWEFLQGETLLWLSAVLIGVSLITLFVWRVKTWFVTLKVTTERCIFQRGLIARQTSEVRHDDVRNMQIDQTLIQRLFGVGSLAISSSGQDDFEIRAHGIPRPEAIVETIRSYQ